MSEPVATVDAHQHYWQFKNFSYSWQAGLDLPAMRLDYMPAAIVPQMQALGIQYSVLIQADNSLEETTWMLELARQYSHIAGVVGWVDLAAPDVATTLDELAQESLFKGIRLMPTPIDNWDTLKHGLHALAERKLTCDLLPDEQSLPAVTEMIRAHPETRFVVDHLAGLPLIPGSAAPWREKLRLLAALPHVSLKFSAIQGLAEPAPINAPTLQPYLDSALNLFGADRLLFASDWPVSTLSGAYAECIQVMREVTVSLSADEQARIWGGTAIATYGLTLRR
jgi:L-fuconolactonase